MEYSFYEFRTVNRTLTKHEQAAVELDLKELAIFQNNLPAFEQKFALIKQKHERSNALMKRFEKARLM